MRVVAYCTRQRNWSMFGNHLLVVYFILMFLMTVDGFIQIEKQSDEKEKEALLFLE